MACKSCAERRRKLAEMKAGKKAKRQHIQAAALGAVLAVTDAAAKVVGIDNGEVEGEESRVQGDDARPSQERDDDGGRINGGASDGSPG